MRKTRKPVIFVLVFIFLFLGLGFVVLQYSDLKKDYSSEDSEAGYQYTTSIYNEPEGRRLRVISEDINVQEDVFRIGGTIGVNDLTTEKGKILLSEFNYVTPEADFKHAIVKREEIGWDWERADKWVEFLEQKDMVLRIHAPIGPQCAEWVKEDQVEVELLSNSLEAFLTAIGERYDGKEGFKYLDVVNETVSKGDWLGEKPGVDKWENPWVKIGYDNDSNRTPLYISQAFRVVGESSSEFKLIYNHHEGPEREDSWDLIKETIIYLRKKGLRVDGIGWQAHVETGWELESGNVEKLEDLISWAHENDLGFHITEASAWLKMDNPEDLDYIAQGETYAAILKVLLSNKDNGLVTWNTWHISDDKTWHKEWRPSLFDSKYQAKLTYYSVQSTLEEFMVVDIKVDFDGNGKLDSKDYGIILGDWADYFDNNKLNDRTDLNGNGKIDGSDYTLFLQGWSDYFDK